MKLATSTRSTLTPQGSVASSKALCGECCSRGEMSKRMIMMIFVMIIIAILSQSNIVSEIIGIISINYSLLFWCGWQTYMGWFYIIRIQSRLYNQSTWIKREVSSTIHIICVPILCDIPRMICRVFFYRSLQQWPKF